MPVALAELELTELGVERLEKAVMKARRLRETVPRAKEQGKAAMAEAGRPVSLWLLFFLLLPAFSASKQAFFLAFDKCFLHIFSFFSLLFFFQRSFILFLLSLVSATAFSNSLSLPPF